MRVILADLRATGGVVSKDTVAGGYGSRLQPFSRVTGIYCYFKSRFWDLPSVQLGYLGAILANAGHEIVFTRERVPEGDAAIVLSSLVDYRHETAWADRARARGTRTGFVGLAASKMPQLFAPHADFVIAGEPEDAGIRMAAGERLAGLCPSAPISDLDSLPLPRWDLLAETGWSGLLASRWARRFPVLASRSCPEHCTYCPHRILAPYRARSVASIVGEIEALCARYETPKIVFRDPLFTHSRERCLELCERIRSRGLRLHFECETRLDELDAPLLDEMYAAGLRAISFGVESVSKETLRKAGRRYIPEAQQRAMVDQCRKLGIATAAFYVIGFLHDDWDTIAAMIDHSISLGSTFAQFKILTPYPGTPMWKQLAPRVRETDWEKFDGYTPTFEHPTLSSSDLRFLLGAAFARFYARPSWLANYWRLHHSLEGLFERMDRKVFEWHREKERTLVSRTAEC